MQSQTRKQESYQESLKCLKLNNPSSENYS